MKEIIIDDIDELIKFINEKPMNYIFRGHSNSNWKLESSLERIVNNGSDKDRYEKAENYTLDIFKSKYHLYDQNGKTPKTKLQWLSIMQHYGVPTRLLDFTESPYVALYFALENYIPSSNQNFSLYAIDYRELMNKSIDIINSLKKSKILDYSEINSRKEEIFNEIIKESDYKILWVTEPSRFNKRLDRQAGCFLLTNDINIKIEDIIRSENYKNVDMFKVIIDNSLCDNIFTLINKVNINSKTIYGDLEGLSKSIEMTLKFYNN